MAKENWGWQGRTAKLRRRGEYVFSNKAIPADIVFHAKNREGEMEEISAHKVLLAMGSDVFEKQLFGPNMETVQQITVANYKAEVFRIAVEFLYSDRTPAMTAENAMDVLKCAEEYHIADLVVKCRVLILQEMGTSGAVNDVLFAMAKMKIPASKEKQPAAVELNTGQHTRYPSSLVGLSEGANTTSSLYCSYKTDVPSFPGKVPVHGSGVVPMSPKPAYHSGLGAISGQQMSFTIPQGSESASRRSFVSENFTQKSKSACDSVQPVPKSKETAKSSPELEIETAELANSSIPWKGLVYMSVFPGTSVQDSHGAEQKAVTPTMAIQQARPVENVCGEMDPNTVADRPMYVYDRSTLLRLENKYKQGDMLAWQDLKNKVNAVFKKGSDVQGHRNDRYHGQGRRGGYDGLRGSQMPIARASWNVQ